MLCQAAVLIGIVATAPVFGRPPGQPVAPWPTFPPMPAAVRQTILNEATVFEIEDCERTTEDGESVYEISYLRAGIERSFTVAFDGTLRSQQYFRNELPPAVQKGVAALEERNLIGDIYWCHEDGELVYEVETGVGDKKRFCTLSPDGTHLATQRLIGELPEPAQKTIREQAGSAQIVGIGRDETDVNEVYDVVLLRDGKRRGISVNAAGDIVATQIILLQAPAAVQDTIIQTAGAARIVYIGQCQEEGTTSFVVVTYQDAQRDEFIVNMDGTLHGHVVPIAALPEAAQKLLRTKADGARIARIEKLVNGTFEADLDRRGKKQTLAFTAEGMPR